VKKHTFKFSLGDKVKRLNPIRYSKSANTGHVVGREFRFKEPTKIKELYFIIWNDNIQSSLYGEFLEKVK
jgi:hypothetical protein